MKQILKIGDPPRRALPLWGRRVEFDDFFVELVPAGSREFNVKLDHAFASISFAPDEGRSSLAGDRLRKYDRRPYEWIVAPARFPLSGQSPDAPEVLVMVFSFDILRPSIAAAQQIPTDRLESRVVIAGPAAFPTELAKRIRRHILADDASTDYIRSLCFVLLVEMLALPRDQRATGRGEVLDDKVLDAAIRFIDGNLDADLSVETLSRLCGVVTHRFSRAFKKSVGETPHRYVTARRIETARQLLTHSDDPIADIAYATGFSSQSHMTTAFRQQLGTTPAKLRE